MKNIIYRRIYEQYLIESIIEKKFRKGQLKGTLHLSFGQEAVDAIVGYYYQHANFFGNHRSHGQFLNFNKVRFVGSAHIEELFNQIKGFGGSQHLFKENPLFSNKFFISNGVQGNLCPVAVGSSFASKLKGEQKENVLVIGDGTLGEGVLYESLNMLKVFDLPLVVVVIDNGYSMAKTKTDKKQIYKTLRTFGFHYKYFSPEECANPDILMNKFYPMYQKRIAYHFEVKRICGHSINDTRIYVPKEEKTKEFGSKYSPFEFVCTKEPIYKKYYDRVIKKHE